MSEETTETEYFSKDFQWETLKQQIESNPSYHYHLLPFTSPSPPPSLHDSVAWQQFHTRHSSGKFFKERRYLLKEFPELLSCREVSKVVLEVGCGNGSSVIPILRGNKDIIVYACDCSNETLERAKEIVLASNIVNVHKRFYPFFCDFALTGFPKWLFFDFCSEAISPTQDFCLSDSNETCVKDSSSSCLSNEGPPCICRIDFVTLIFTLSAVPYERMPRAIAECFSVLKPGGLLLFRDYGLYDMSMLRFTPDKRVGFREYMRSDGTRSYFFCLDTVRDLFLRSVFIELELEYCCVKSVNRRKEKSMQRVWVHGRFRKPIEKR